ncbi:sensor histidine kinase [Diplocloster hominis]|uniref:sensor histidine kinase n=1 Tax=Diplocloster hominis TaxID=3079010 RepID=UPI0031B9CEA5
MLSKQDNEKMLALMEENPDAREIIQKLQECHKVTLSKVSHELRNSLTLINSSMQFIQSSHPEVKDFPHWYSTIEDIKNLIILLQDLSAIGNASKLRLNTIDPYASVKAILESARSLIENNHIQLESECEENLPCFQGDEAKLREAIFNLIINACDAVHENGCIRIRLFKEGSYIIFKITDNGCGIDEASQELIFEPFVTTKKSGTGIGLPLAAEIVRAHGGILTLESELGKGSTFTVKIPY